MGIFEGMREPPAPLRTDAELLTAHVSGDRYAFEELFYRHQCRMAEEPSNKGQSINEHPIQRQSNSSHGHHHALTTNYSANRSSQPQP